MGELDLRQEEGNLAVQDLLFSLTLVVVKGDMVVKEDISHNLEMAQISFLLLYNLLVKDKSVMQDLFSPSQVELDNKVEREELYLKVE